MTRTPARTTPAFGWKFPIPPRVRKLARVAVALSLAAISVVSVGVQPASAAAASKVFTSGQPAANAATSLPNTVWSTQPFVTVGTTTAATVAHLDTLTVTLLKDDGAAGAFGVAKPAVATLSGATADGCTVTGTTSSQCARQQTIATTNADKFTFTGLKVDKPGFYQLSSVLTDQTDGSDGGEAAVVSSSIAIEGLSWTGDTNGAGTGLIAGVQPGSVGAGVKQSPAVVLIAPRAITDTVTVTLQTASGGTPLTGTTLTMGTVTFSAGAAGTTACSGVTCTLSLSTTIVGKDSIITLVDTTVNFAGTYRLAASTTVATTAVNSGTFQISGPAAAAGSALSFTVQPGSSTGGSALTPAPQVTLGTATAVATADSANTVTITLANAAGTPVLFTATAMTSLSSSVTCDSTANSCTTVMSAGIANFPGVTLNKGGSYVLLASTTATPASPATSNLFTVGTGAGTSLTQKGGPVGAAPAQLISQQPRIELTDAGGNTLETQTGGNVYATLYQCMTQAEQTAAGLTAVACKGISGTSNTQGTKSPANGAALMGTTVAPIKAGVAQFGGLNINLAGDYVIVYTSDLGGVAGTTTGSTAINIRANQLRVSGVPSFMLQGQLINGVVTVQLQDGAGNVIANSTDSVTIGATKSSATQPLTGPGCTSNKCTQPLVNGVAQFAGLTLGATAVAGTTTFRADMATTATTFTTSKVDNEGNTAAGAQSGKATDWQLLWIASPGAADAGKALSPQPGVALANTAGVIQNDSIYNASVFLADKDGKAVKDVKLTGSSCAADGTSCTLVFVNGIASFSGISVDTPGTYTLTAKSNKVDGDNKLVTAVTPSAQFIVGGAAAGAGGATGAPSLPASKDAPENTVLSAIYTSIPALKDIKTSNVSWSYLGPSSVVVNLLTPPLWTATFPVGCYSGPNATSSEASASVLFGTKSAGTDFILFFIRGTRSYSFDVAAGNYCWIDLIAS